MRRQRLWFRVAALLLLPAGLARAGAELVLLDGKVLAGRSVERKGGTYLLESDRGFVMPVPVELVKEMHLTGGDAPVRTGLTYSEPETLAGSDVKIPTFRDQVAAFGKPPVVWAGSPASWRWDPTDAFEGQDHTEFSPARWAQPILDPIWVPVSGFRSDGGVTQFSPARWRADVLSPMWQPRDSFGETEWFAPVVSPQPAPPSSASR